MLAMGASSLFIGAYSCPLYLSFVVYRNIDRSYVTGVKFVREPAIDRLSRISVYCFRAAKQINSPISSSPSLLDISGTRKTRVLMCTTG